LEVTLDIHEDEEDDGPQQAVRLTARELDTLLDAVTLSRMLGNRDRMRLEAKRPLAREALARNENLDTRLQLIAARLHYHRKKLPK
jgi:hypothetical protein